MDSSEMEFQGAFPMKTGDNCIGVVSMVQGLRVMGSNLENWA